MSHPAADYVGFLDMKQLGVLLLPPWWDASSSQGYPPNISSGFPDNLPGQFLSPTSDLKRISPYAISTISSKQVMRVKKISIKGLLVDPIPNSPN